ncbi:hypothetical protein DOM22_10995 [Bdellovibrio sp. ZAP7]|uniref:hypothetical protein n=1 Tax=Bdellovibrio sp. ZAP7 TaxID=2231053 RepID=UPI0011576B3A|nr:hypothetical protein [Bdellovibrio sp. ZAP7]QDK45638.1 hypothetical protein DOM22_10995 [Bdellovibrio sp. ZAP7]
MANDSDSIKFKTYTIPLADKKRGWPVGGDFYGKNAFGGTVKNSRWFLIQHDMVVSSSETP